MGGATLVSLSRSEIYHSGNGSVNVFGYSVDMNLLRGPDTYPPLQKWFSRRLTPAFSEGAILAAPPPQLLKAAPPGNRTREHRTGPRSSRSASNSPQSGPRGFLAASSPHHLAPPNVRRRLQGLPAETQDRHRPPLPEIVPGPSPPLAPHRPFPCCNLIPSVDSGLSGDVVCSGFLTYCLLLMG